MKQNSFTLFKENSLNDCHFLNTILYKNTTRGSPTCKMVTVDLLKTVIDAKHLSPYSETHYAN